MMALHGTVYRIAPIALGLALAGTGCATKKFVGREVTRVDERLSGVETQVEDAQVRLRDHDARINTTSRTAQEALDRATAAGKLAAGKLLYETVLTDDEVKFGFDQKELSPAARAALDEFASQLRGQNKNVYIEIQGHTDGIGVDAYNERLGQSRADAARFYLAKQGIPLHRMNSISYGETAPVADNGSREGRAQNRRVVLVVLQ
jgi:outer membrane protein OmpA-like peptidoglycan-associated protein